MREVKFRAWYKNTKEMLEVEEIKLHTSPHMILKLSGKSPIHYFGVGDNCTLMEYTGLKDKNGVEIYEGDILAIEDATAKVVFWQRPPAFGLNFYHNEDKWCEDWNLSDDSERMEIVGNIYANPELLKEIP